MASAMFAAAAAAFITAGLALLWLIARAVGIL
jgi:hypothetical protein